MRFLSADERVVVEKCFGVVDHAVWRADSSRASRSAAGTNSDGDDVGDEGMIFFCSGEWQRGVGEPGQEPT